MRANPAAAWLYRRAWDLRHPETRFCFLASTGRSGTLFMQRLFASIPGVAAAHEPYPIMNAQPMIAAQRGDTGAIEREYWVRKSVNMRRLAGSAELYCECNHMFVKSFWRLALEDLGDRVSVVHLRRDVLEVARSMAQLPYIPGQERGNLWYLDWRAPENHIQASDLLEVGAAFDDPYYACVWYWYEIEARVDYELRPRVPADRLLPLHWQGSFEPDAVRALLDGMALRYDAEAVAELCVRPVNQQQGLKEEANAPRLSLEEATERHDEFVDVLRTRLDRLPGIDPL